jgi:hypothetical protein
LQEIENLKGNGMLSRPGTASVEVAKLKQEKEAVIVENQRLQR